MHGSPLLRALVLTALLAVTGLLIAALAGRHDDTDTPLSQPLPTSAAATIPALLSLQLSAPVRTLTLTTLDGTSLLSLTNPALDTEHPLTIPSDPTLTLLLSLTWETPATTNFLRLVLEPEQRDSRQTLLHAPDHLDQHAIEFTWDAE